jgi:hypothetical protein
MEKSQSLENLVTSSPNANTHNRYLDNPSTLDSARVFTPRQALAITD